MYAIRSYYDAEAHQAVVDIDGNLVAGAVSALTVQIQTVDAIANHYHQSVAARLGVRRQA